MKTIQLLIIIGILATSGCGTIMSRGLGEHKFGYPLYLAPRYDLTMPAYVTDQTDWKCGTAAGIGCAISFPIDFVLDTLFLPADLVTGIWGHHKE